jgi:hypothetical protein
MGRSIDFDVQGCAIDFYFYFYREYFWLRESCKTITG